MLFVFMLILVIAGLYLFGQQIPDPWGNLWTSLLTIFAITTKDAWNAYQDDMDDYYGHVSSLVVAAVTDNFSGSAEAEAHLYKKLHISQISKFVEAKLNENQGKLKYLLKCQDSTIFNNRVNASPTEGMEFIQTLTQKGNIDPKLNIFANPSKMKAVYMSLLKIQENNKTKQQLYNEMFQRLLKMSEFKKSAKSEM